LPRCGHTSWKANRDEPFRPSRTSLADILHVATALHLGVKEFLTFDANQKLLAEAEGMNVRV
jgi:predicted nucleic acid-binding protein